MYFIISDIHGCLHEFNTILRKWDREKETLIILGDMIDRGYDSFGVVNKVMNLKKQYGEKVIVLKGNHEDEFIKWLYSTPMEQSYYYSESLHETIKSFYPDKKKFQKDTRKQRATFIKRNYFETIRFIKELPLFYETPNMIFVHAGINLYHPNWNEDQEYMLWAREEFYNSDIISSKRIFFGHTPTNLIDPNKKHNVWISKYGDKVNIDGGCVFGGKLNAIKVDENGKIRDVTWVRREDILINKVI